MKSVFVFSFMVLKLSKVVFSLTIDVPECEPPDYPQWGGYGPRQPFYLAGDFIHYYCETDTFIGGNYYRRCEDTGDWTGNAPVCDGPQTFSFVNQTSSADPLSQNAAESASDGDRTTCSSTKGEQGSMWVGTLTNPGQLFRVSVFSPLGEVAYEVFLVRGNGQEISCGRRVERNEYLNWVNHNCPEPNNTNATGLKIVSLSSSPLQLCEVHIYVLSAPTCVDPHVRIENGHLQLSRKTATLVCHSGFARSRETRLNCIRNGQWTKKTLYCAERQWEVGNREPASNQDP